MEIITQLNFTSQDHLDILTKQNEIFNVKEEEKEKEKKIEFEFHKQNNTNIQLPIGTTSNINTNNANNLGSMFNLSNPQSNFNPYGGIMNVPVVDTILGSTNKNNEIINLNGLSFGNHISPFSQSLYNPQGIAREHGEFDEGEKFGKTIKNKRESFRDNKEKTSKKERISSKKIKANSNLSENRSVKKLKKEKIGSSTSKKSSNNTNPSFDLNSIDITAMLKRGTKTTLHNE